MVGVRLSWGYSYIQTLESNSGSTLCAIDNSKTHMKRNPNHLLVDQNSNSHFRDSLEPRCYSAGCGRP